MKQGSEGGAGFIVETRPLMRCMQHVADCLYLTQLDENEKFKTHAKMFKDDTFAIALFNRAPFAL